MSDLSNNIEGQYLRLLAELLAKEPTRMDRTGVGTSAVFGRQLRANLQEGFPLFTTKQVHFKSIWTELMWILSGSTNVKWLQENGCRIWNEWADENGDLGPVYGKQWRSWSGTEGQEYDQIVDIIDLLVRDPMSRRMVVSAWNPADSAKMALTPCHAMFQFFVEDNKLSCQLYQRSCDIVLGVPFNIASYALLTQLIAKELGYELGEFIWSGGDIHLYSNHREQAKEQLTRSQFPFPKLTTEGSLCMLLSEKDPEASKHLSYRLENYRSHGKLVAPVAV
jgi:thymidylate synthase